VSTLRRARSLARVLPGVTEEDHHGMGSFRVVARFSRRSLMLTTSGSWWTSGRSAQPSPGSRCVRRTLLGEGSCVRRCSAATPVGELASGVVDRGVATARPRDRWSRSFSTIRDPRERFISLCCNQFHRLKRLVFSHLAYCVAESPARPGKTAATPDSAIRIRWTEGPLLSGSAHAAMTWAVDRLVFNSFLIRCAPGK
jgi:hypothetical protein